MSATRTFHRAAGFLILAAGLTVAGCEGSGSDFPSDPGAYLPSDAGGVALAGSDAAEDLAKAFSGDGVEDLTAVAATPSQGATLPPVVVVAGHTPSDAGRKTFRDAVLRAADRPKQATIAGEEVERARSAQAGLPLDIVVWQPDGEVSVAVVAFDDEDLARSTATAVINEATP